MPKGVGEGHLGNTAGCLRQLTHNFNFIFPLFTHVPSNVSQFSFFVVDF